MQSTSGSESRLFYHQCTSHVALMIACSPELMYACSYGRPTDSIRYSRQQQQEAVGMLETEVDDQGGSEDRNRSTTVREIPNVLYAVPKYVIYCTFS